MYANFAYLTLLEQVNFTPRVQRRIKSVVNPIQNVAALSGVIRNQGRQIAMGAGNAMINAGKNSMIRSAFGRGTTKKMVGLGKDIYTAGAGRQGFLGHGKFLPNKWQRNFRKITQ